MVLYENVEMPIEKGTRLGEYELYLDDIKIDTIPMIATDTAGYWNVETVWQVILLQFLSVAS